MVGNPSFRWQCNPSPEPSNLSLVRRSIYCILVIALSAVFGGARKPSAQLRRNPYRGNPYALHFLDLHSGKRLDVVYRNANGYDPQSLVRLDSYLRDRRTGQVHAYDPRVFDLLRDLLISLGRPQGEIDVICGYRTPWSNALLHNTGHHVAVHSLHMQAMAIDIRVPGVSTARLRDAALALHRGGVGYYPHSRFVHVDVGRVRRW